MIVAIDAKRIIRASGSLACEKQVRREAAKHGWTVHVLTGKGF